MINSLPWIQWQCVNSIRPMATRPIYLYFTFLSLLVYLLAPEWVLDIPTTYMLKNHLHATAPRVSSTFRLLTGIPALRGIPLRSRPRPLESVRLARPRLFLHSSPPLTAAVFIWLAVTPLSWNMLLIGVILAMATFRLILAAFQGLIALIGQETLMTGRLSTLSSSCYQVAIIGAALISGAISENLTPPQTFFLMAALMLLIGAFGFLKPAAVFGHAYEKPQAKGSDFRGDVRRLLQHRAIYPAVLISFLWWFNPGLNTPVQFYLTNQLHASDAAYSNFLGVFAISFIPTYLLYGYLCTKIPPSRLLWWSTLIAVPQMIPLAFVPLRRHRSHLRGPDGPDGRHGNGGLFRSGRALLPARPAGHSDDAGLGRRRMLAARGGDLLGAKLYASSEHGFLYCVIATTVVYALILPVILWIPKEVIATTDGQSNPALGAEILAEIG